MDRETIQQRKTGRPVRFEQADQTRLAIDEYLRLTGREPGQFLFAGGNANWLGDRISNSGYGIGPPGVSRDR